MRCIFGLRIYGDCEVKVIGVWSDYTGSRIQLIEKKPVTLYYVAHRKGDYSRDLQLPHKIIQHCPFIRKLFYQFLIYFKINNILQCQLVYLLYLFARWKSNYKENPAGLVLNPTSVVIDVTERSWLAKGENEVLKFSMWEQERTGQGRQVNSKVCGVERDVLMHEFRVEYPLPSLLSIPVNGVLCYPCVSLGIAWD